MHVAKSYVAFAAILVSMSLPSICWARSALEDLMAQVDAMQQEIFELRGKLEEQQHALEVANQKQDKLFVNLDSRITALNSKDAKTPVAAATPAVTTPVVSATTPEVTNNTAANTLATEEPILEENQITELSAEPTPEPVLTPAPVTLTEKQAYDAAYKLMNEKRYPEAITAFTEVLANYPDGKYSANAYYWLGEVHMAQWQTNKSDTNLIAQATEEFQNVLNKYPEHHKAVDAMLKLGIIAYDQQKWSEARDVFNQLILSYPGTSRAKLAEAKIKIMQEQGHSI